MKKVLYALPAVAICVIYGLIGLLLGFGDAAVDFVHSVAALYLLLPIIGSVLLIRGNWWGGLVGMTMGLLLIWNNLHYHGYQHVNIDLPLGITFAAYYGLMVIVSLRKK